jgi:hypothetical protein
MVAEGMSFHAARYRLKTQRFAEVLAAFPILLDRLEAAEVERDQLRQRIETAEKRVQKLEHILVGRTFADAEEIHSTISRLEADLARERETTQVLGLALNGARKALAEAAWCKPGCESRMLVESELIEARVQAAELVTALEPLLERDCVRCKSLGWPCDDKVHCPAKETKDILTNLPALTAAHIERDKRRDEALEWYGNENNYANAELFHFDNSPVAQDFGARARRALGKEAEA